MKNTIKNNFKIFAVSLALVGLVSCESKDVPGLDPQPKTSFATTTVTSLTLNEGDSGVIPFTINQAISKPSQFKIELVNSTLAQSDLFAGDQEMDGDTFEPGNGFEITVPAYATSFDIPVQALSDIWPEQTESATLKISAAGVRTILVENEYKLVNLTINDVDGDNFIWRMEWDQSFTGTDGETYSFCDNVDLDLEIYDTAFAGPLATSYSDCPEEINLAMGDLPDGDYWLVPSFWNQETVVPAGLQITANFTFARPGVWVSNSEYTGWNTTDGGVLQGTNTYLVRYQLNVAGNVYTVTDMDSNTVLGTGKMANFVGGRLRK